MLKTALAGLALAMLTGACQQPAPTDRLETETDAPEAEMPQIPPGGPVARNVYLCGGEQVEAELTRSQAVITWRGVTHTLEGVRAASGTKFEGEGVMFWAKGQTALLEVGGEMLPECTLQPREAGAASGGVPGALAGPEWIIEDIDGAGIIDMSNATIEFGDGGQVSGRASCNRYTGRWSWDGERLTLTPLAVTRMACAPALMQQEQRVLEILQAVEGWSVDDTGALILHTRDGRTLKARR